jgi:hypothetical protein
VGLVTTREKIVTKARKHHWHVDEYPNSLILKKEDVKVTVRFGGNKGGEGIEAATWNHNPIHGQNKLRQVLRALEQV